MSNSDLTASVLQRQTSGATPPAKAGAEDRNSAREGFAQAFRDAGTPKGGTQQSSNGEAGKDVQGTGPAGSSKEKNGDVAKGDGEVKANEDKKAEADDPLRQLLAGLATAAPVQGSNGVNPGAQVAGASAQKSDAPKGGADLLSHAARLRALLAGGFGEAEAGAPITAGSADGKQKAVVGDKAVITTMATSALSLDRQGKVVSADFVSLKTHFEPTAHHAGSASLAMEKGAATAASLSMTASDPSKGEIADFGKNADRTKGKDNALSPEAKETSSSSGPAIDISGREGRTSQDASSSGRHDNRGDRSKSGSANGVPGITTVKHEPDGDAGLARQIGETIGNAARHLRADQNRSPSANSGTGSSQGGAPAGGPMSGDVMRAGGRALKTLQIQLQPETLGKLDVTMKLVGGQLSIHLMATNADTALRLQDDTDSLHRLLSKAGFTVGDASITVSAANAAGQTQSGSSANSGGQNSSGQNAAGQNNSGQNAGSHAGGSPAGGGEQRPDGRHARRDAHHPGGSSRNDRSGADQRSGRSSSIYL